MTSVAILFTLLLQFGCSFQQDNAQSFDPNIDDIYKCVSYTAAHIDISHSINDDFSEFKNCQTSRIHTLNRKDRYFKLDIDVQNSWIVDVINHPSAIAIASTSIFMDLFRCQQSFSMVQSDRFVDSTHINFSFDLQKVANSMV